MKQIRSLSEFTWCTKLPDFTLIQLQHEKTNNVVVHQEKTQISLGISSVWFESSLSSWRRLWSIVTLWPQSEDSDQSGWMHNLIRVCALSTLRVCVDLLTPQNLNRTTLELFFSLNQRLSIWPFGRRDNMHIWSFEFLKFGNLEVLRFYPCLKACKRVDNWVG